MVPEGWSFEPLGQLTSFASGGTPSKQDPKNWGGDFPWVSAKDLKSHHLDDAQLKLTPKGRQLAKIAPKNAVLILVRGMTLLKNVPLGITTRELAFNQDIKALIVEGAIDALFLSYALVAAKRELMSLVSTANHGTGRLDTNALQDFHILLPPIEEQRRIAEILGTWDRAIETTENLIAASEAQKKALMQQLLTGKKRLPGFEGEVSVVPLTSTATIQTGNSNREDSSEVGEFTFFDRSTDVRRSNRYLFNTEAIIVGGEGQEFVPKYFVGKFDLHQRAYAIHNFVDCDGRYIFYCVHFNRHFLRRFAVGSTVASLRMSTFEKLPVRLPDIREQTAIAEILLGADAEIKFRNQQLQTLKTEKAALMQQLLTGKRRVNLKEMAA